MATTMPRTTYSPRTRSRSSDSYSRRKDPYHSHHRDRYQSSHHRSHTPDYSSRSPSPSPRRHQSNKRRRSRSRSPDYHHHRQRSYSRSPRRREQDEEDGYNRSPSPRQPRRSPSPYSKRHRRSSYSRSRSPPRRSKEASSSKKSTGGGGGGGFKWKDPTRTTNAEASAGGEEKKGLDRGYSSHYTHQPTRPKSPSPERDDLASKFGTGYSACYNRPASTTAAASDGVAAKFGTSTTTTTTAADGSGNGDDDDERRRRKREKKERKAREGPKPVSGPMIVVNVNDRLGTKVAVPCLASDPIRLFKAQVAARVGRQPHEIMLKRQGERPFRDGLTLEDYGVSNGVQLDLEVDTGE